jgi:hypothetical protein
MIDPTIDAFTTSWSPSISAKKAMISSGALPNVTFSRPPIPGPVRARDHAQRGRAEHEHRVGVRELERDRDRDEDAEVVHGPHGAATLRGTVDSES